MSDIETRDNDDNLQSVYNPLAAMHENEQVLLEVKRHPIGIIGVYFASSLVLVGVITAAILIPRYVNVGSKNQLALWLGAGIVAAIALLYTYVASVIYKGNRWILTDDSLTQVSQDGLFRKQSSQLSLANLEDVTANQDGIIPSLFGFGVLHVETAGERSKFVFPYCPKPNDCARAILEARENFIRNEPEVVTRANDKLQVPQPMVQTQQPTPPYQPPVYQNPVPQQPYQQPPTPQDNNQQYPNQNQY